MIKSPVTLMYEGKIYMITWVEGMGGRAKCLYCSNPESYRRDVRVHSMAHAGQILARDSSPGCDILKIFKRGMHSGRSVCRKPSCQARLEVERETFLAREGDSS